MTEVEQLKAECADLGNRLSQVEDERDHYRKLYQQMLEKARKLELGLLDQKAERTPEDASQLSLQLLAGLLQERGLTLSDEELEAIDGLEDHRPEPSKRRKTKPTGRQVIPGHLPVVDIEIIPAEVEAEGIENFEQIGEEVLSTLERRPASLVHCKIHRLKFARKERDKQDKTEIMIAEPVGLPIERGLGGPGLMATTVLQRFADHLPLHRLQKIYAREGVTLAKSTVCGWHQSLAKLCRPLIDAMWADAKANSPYLCTDATGVLVRDLEKCRRGHFWVVIAPGVHVLFRYTAKHDGDAVDSMLADYQGVLVADAHSVYNHLYKDGEVIEAACWAHARRYFYKCLQSEPERSREALALIGRLFDFERGFEGMTPKKRKAARQLRSRPVVDAFFDWCDALADEVLDDTPLAKAIGYARNQREALHTFLRDGRLPIHNNGSERELRREAVGRKNWLFVGNDEAGEVNATFVSLIASCEMHGIEPYGYLRDLLCLLPGWPARRVLELSPAKWTETLENEETQKLLAGDVFRQVALGEFDAQLESG